MAEPTTPLANYQNEIYLTGALTGALPEFPITVADMEAAARAKLEDGPYGYVAGGASSEDTMRANLDAFRRWRIVPRMLRDVAVRDLSTEVFGTRMPAPVMLAPIGVQSIVHPDGEIAVARAAASQGVPMIASTASSFTMEQIAEAGGPRWYQLYWPRERELATSFVRRAEDAGYEAIVVTLDTWLLAWRPKDLANAYLPFLKLVGTANYTSDPVFLKPLEKSPEEDAGPAVMRFLGVFSDPGVTWDHLSFLRETTKLPILLKGILHPGDARRALDHGMDGIIVSNHGGRQVDGAIGALDALPGVVDAVEGRAPVLFDSGIRTGADVFKAIALGAKAVLLGRPFMWGLAVGGEDGVRHVIRSLLADLDLTLALSGYTSFDRVDRTALERI